MSASTEAERNNQDRIVDEASLSMQPLVQDTKSESITATLPADGSKSESETTLAATTDDSMASPSHTLSSPIVPGAFASSSSSSSSTIPSSSSSLATASDLSKAQDASDKPLPAIADSDAAITSPDTAVASSLQQQQQQQQLLHIPGPSMPKSELESSMITTVSPVRRSIYKRKMSSQPKGILKPAPPPQKGFSFRRDILQSINTRLAQQGVNVQVPMPQSGTAQATASYIGGMFRKIGGIAAGAAANVSGSNSTTVGGLLSNDTSFNSNGSSLYSQGSLDDTNANKSGSNIMSSSGSTAIASQQNDSENGSTTSLVKNTVLSSTTSAAPLKKVQFQVSHMSVTYPIVGAGTPEDEDLTRLRIEREHRRMLKARRGKPWTPEQLEALYRECCRTREEHPLKKMRLVFQEAAQSIPPALKTMDLSFVPLDRHAVEPIADLLSVDFGLNKLVLENCALTDDTVKSILHALLVSGTLPNLSIASNRKIRFRGWKYVAIFMRRARALRYLDLSENSIDRLSLEHLLAVIIKPPSAVTYHRTQPSRAAKKTADAKPEADGKETSKDAESAEHQVKDGGEDDDDDEDDEFFDDSGEPLMPTAPLLRDVSDDPDPPTSAVTSLRLENCGLKAASLEMLSQAVRFSDIRHLSLRRNKIGQLASVALAIMLKDYPDSVIASDTQTSSASARKSYFDPASAPFSTASGMADAEVFQRNGRTLRPSDGLTTSERFARSYSPGLPEVPVIVSSPGGGITSRKMPGSHQVNGGSEQRPTTFYGVHTEQLQDAMQTSIAGPTAEIDLNLTPQQRLEIRSNSAPNLSEEEAVAIYQAKRARRILADLPRVGNLLTLDLKSNDIRGGVVYLAQVLKKNRTLRVLNLSDNNIEMPGLVAVAEALKYNSTLETLDMSHNPCSGPGLEGITTLRTAFALNSNLKRLFLNDTDLSSEAAIALAEFLPEARSLIHLDLAENFDIDIAGVMALAVSLRMNQSLRCLDLNIPPNNPDFARLSQEILQSCVRNTELAQQRAAKKGLKQRIAAPIYRSVVARAARENDERLKAIETARATAISAAAAKDRAAVQDLLTAAGECRSVLRDLLSGEEKRQLEAPEQKLTPPGEFVEDLTVQSAKLRKRLGELAGTVEEEDLLESILTVHDELSEVSTRLERFYQYGIAAIGKPGDGVRIEGEMTSVHLTTPDQGVVESGLTSPAFSIADSDEEDSEVESGSGKPRSRIAVGASGASANGEASNMPQHSRSHQASLSDMMDGLGIQTHSVDRDSADREEREPEHEHEHELGADGSPLPPRAPTETLAKGQLSEEAELFRKTKCLQYDFHARHSQDDERLARLGTTPDLACTPTAPPSPHTDPLQAAVHNAHLSGEQLRKDLLRAHVPPKSLTSTP